VLSWSGPQWAFCILLQTSLQSISGEVASPPVDLQAQVERSRLPLVGNKGLRETRPRLPELLTCDFNLLTSSISLLYVLLHDWGPNASTTILSLNIVILRTCSKSLTLVFLAVPFSSVLFHGRFMSRYPSRDL
jgi:hypothetical protein